MISKKMLMVVDELVVEMKKKKNRDRKGKKKEKRGIRRKFQKLEGSP